MNDSALSELTHEVKRIMGEMKISTKELEARLHHLEQRHDDRPSGIRGLESGFAQKLVEKIEAKAAFLHMKEGNAGTCRESLEMSIKALVTEGMGNSDDTTVPLWIENRPAVEEVRRPLTLMEALPIRPVTSDASQFVQIVATGDAAEQEKEGDEKAEIVLDGISTTAYIATIAGHTTLSRQALDSPYQLTQAISNTMKHKVRSKFENLLINGTGGQGKIDGLINQGTPFTPAIGATPADIIGEALTQQQADGYAPGLVVMNPMDWFTLTVTKTTTEEEYMFGSPTRPLPPSLWNTRVALTPSLASGQVLTIDTSFTTILDRMQPAMLVSSSHKDYFTRNLVLLLVELRAGLEVLDPDAVFVTDINTSGP